MPLGWRHLVRDGVADLGRCAGSVRASIGRHGGLLIVRVAREPVSGDRRDADALLQRGADAMMVRAATTCEACGEPDGVYSSQKQSVLCSACLTE